MAERVTETLNKPDSELIDVATKLDETHGYLGEMIMDEKGMIQRIRLESLLSDSQQQYLLAGRNDDSNNTKPN
jgi:chemotaxis-related protein WspB